MNKFINLLLFSVLSLTLAGCAEVTQKTYNANGTNHSGTVRYSTDWFMGSKNRAKAVEQMNEYCLPNKARLQAEDNHAEFSGMSSSNTSFSKSGAYTSTSQSREHYTYLHFKCVRAKS